MTSSILIDSRLKNRIELLINFNDDKDCYMVRFKDISDAFWFDNVVQLQEFLHKQVVERFYDKELRKGYFDYVNENGDALRYHIESKRGKLTLLKDECV